MSVQAIENAERNVVKFTPRKAQPQLVDPIVPDLMNLPGAKLLCAGFSQALARSLAPSSAQLSPSDRHLDVKPFSPCLPQEAEDIHPMPSVDEAATASISRSNASASLQPQTVDRAILRQLLLHSPHQPLSVSPSAATIAGIGNPTHGENAFTPFATRREELRLETERRWSEAILAQTRIGVLAVVIASLCLGFSAALILKRAPEIARAISLERPA